MKKIKTLFCALLFLCMAASAGAQTARVLVNQARQESDPAARIRLLTQAVKKAPKLATAWHYRADTYRMLGKHKQALSDYTQAIRLTPRDPFRYYARALAYMDAKQYAAAEADLSKAILLKKNYPDFYLFRARVNMAQEKYSAAIADYKKYLNYRRKTSLIALDLAQAYFYTYKYPEAEEELFALLDKDPSDAAAYFWLGRIRHNQNRLDEAVSFFSKAINRDEEYAQAYRYRASAFKDMGELEASAEDYSMLVSLDPQDIFYNRRGLVYEEMGDLNKALADYNKTIELSPKWPIAYTNRGYVYLKQKKYNQAKDDFETAIKLDDSLPTPYINLAGVYWLQKKDKRNVYRNLEKALKRSFRDFDSLYDEDRKGWMFKGINKTAEFRAVMYDE